MAANSKFAVATHILAVLGYFLENTQDPMRRCGGLVSSEVVASSVNTNPVVVRKILSQLAKAGLVETQLGKHGGVKLAKPVDQVFLLDIYVAVGESPFFLLNPNDPNPLCPVSSKINSIIQPVFDTLGDTVKKQLGSVSLKMLLAQVA